MEKRKENPITKLNKIVEGKKKIQNGKINWANLTQLNGGFISPINGKNLRILSQDKDRLQSNENLKIKLLDNQLSKSESSSFGIFPSQENNNTSSKGRIINYIKKKRNKNNNCSNSVVLQSKTAKKLTDNSLIRRNNNSLNKNKSLISSNNTNHSTIGNISLSGNQNIEKILAREILKFFDEMKQLQTSICKKEPNVKDLKKNFEKRKLDLYKEALKYTKNENNINNQISQDNRSYSSLFSYNSAFTAGTYNGISYNQNIKELNDSISTLKTALDDLKSNSQFITSQLRTEISNLNNKIISQMNSISQYEKSINSNLNSIKGIYQLLKSISLNINLNTGESIQSQGSFSNSGNLQDNKFEWYENEIKKIISILETKINSIQNGNTGNEHVQEQKSFNSDIPDNNKLYFSIKNASSEIIEMIRPYIDEEENENVFNNIFEAKENIEDGIITNAIENLKKSIKCLIIQIDNLNLDKERILKELNETKMKSESFKKTFHNSTFQNFKNNQSNNENNNLKEDEENYLVAENYKRLNNDLLQIQSDLLQKIEMRDIENEKNQETIKELLIINKNDELNSNNENYSNLVSNEKYRYLLNLYSNEQEQLKQLKSDYLHLIQDLSNYAENGTKILFDVNKISLNTNKRSTNDLNIDEEPDSTDLGRINENDLLTDKNSTISNKFSNNRINSKESKGSNCATFNKYISISNIPPKMSNIKQMSNMKNDLKIYKNEIEKLNKKLTDLNDVLSTISNAISKLFQEVQYTYKGKELFNLIFKLLNYSEDKIHKMFNEKEKAKK